MYEYFSNFDKPVFRHSHIRNVMPKFKSCGMNGVATIEKTYTHFTYPQTYKHHTDRS